jgi:ankyrin repeat protein
MTLEQAASMGDLALLKQLLNQRDVAVDSVDNFGQTALSKAAESGHFKCVFELVQHGANIEHAAPGDGRTPLFLACEGRSNIEGRSETVRYLIHTGAKVDAYDVYQRAPIHVACENNVLGLETVMCLLQAGAWVDFPMNGGSTPLLLAAERGFTEIVRTLLVAYGAQVWTENYDGECALYLAACNGHVDCLRTLIEYADTTARPAERARQDLVHAAFHHGHTDAMRYLIDNGFGFDIWRLRLTRATVQGKLDMVSYLIETLGADINEEDLVERDVTSLFYASFYGLLDITEYLLSCGAEITATFDGRTPLHVAQNRQVAELLLEHGADPNTTDDHGCTPLFLAASNGYQGVVECLLAAGARAGHQDSDHNTPLFKASTKAIAQALLNAGANRSVLNRDGLNAIENQTAEGNFEVVQFLVASESVATNTRALSLAASHGYPDIARILLSDGRALANGNNNDGQPLYNAAASGKERLVRCLLQAGANVDVRINGCTPLTIAVANGRSDVLPLLIEAGSSLNATDRRGDTVFHHAARLGRSDIMLELVAARDCLNLDFSPDIPNNQGNTPLRLLWQEAHRANDPLLARKFHATATALILGGAREWTLIPEPCPGLGSALLKVWRSTPQEMRSLFLKLFPEEQEKVRQMLLSLNRIEKIIPSLLNFGDDIRMQLVQLALQS